MQTAQTDLTIVGAHTNTPAVYWKGQLVPNVTGLRVADGKVVLSVPDDPLLAEMQAAGIVVRRA